MMKRILRKIFVIITLVCIVVSIGAVCHAEKSADEAKKDIEENVNQNLDKLNLNEFDSWLNNLKEGYFSLISEDVKTTLKQIINGDYQGNIGDVFSLIIQIINKQLGAYFPIIVTIIAICILHSIIASMSGEFLSHGIKEVIFFVCYSAIIVLVSTQIVKTVSEARSTITLMQGLMNIVFPMLLTMVVALGGATTGAVYQPLMVTLSTTVANVITKVIFPCFIAVTALCLVGNLSKTVKLGKLEKFIKSASTYTMGVIFSLFVTFLGYQGLTGGIADTVFVKGAKFALQSYIPVLGGYLSDGFDLMMASIVLIKNSLGLISTLAILSLVLMPIIKIILLTLSLKLASGLVEPFADGRFSTLLDDTAKNLSILLTCILVVAFMFFIVIMMIIYTCNLGVV